MKFKNEATRNVTVNGYCWLMFFSCLNYRTLWAYGVASKVVRFKSDTFGIEYSARYCRHPAPIASKNVRKLDLLTRICSSLSRCTLVRLSVLKTIGVKQKHPLLEKVSLKGLLYYTYMLYNRLLRFQFIPCVLMFLPTNKVPYRMDFYVKF